MATTIYALCDPGLQIPVIRYIGKTVQKVEQRFRGHLYGSVKKNTHLGNWLKSLGARGEKPVLMTLTEVPDEIGSAAEILYIRLAREGGMDLVNATDGGEGITMTPEIRGKIGASQLGEKNHMFGKTGADHHRFGKKHSDEQKAKWSHDKSGVHPTGEVLAKMAVSHRGLKLSGASSKFIGVSWHKARKKWQAQFSMPDGKRIYLGLFESETDAAKAYDVAALHQFGPETPLNFPVSCCGSGT